MMSSRARDAAFKIMANGEATCRKCGVVQVRFRLQNLPAERLTQRGNRAGGFSVPMVAVQHR